MVNQTPHCRFDLLRVDTNVQKRSSTCIKRTAGNGRMDDGLNCGRNVPGITRQTNALSFYSLGNEVDKERSRTASLIYKSIVIGITDKFSHPSSHICAVLSSSTNPRRSTATPVICLLDRYSASVQIWATSFYQRFLKSQPCAAFIVPTGQQRRRFFCYRRGEEILDVSSLRLVTL